MTVFIIEQTEREELDRCFGDVTFIAGYTRSEAAAQRWCKSRKRYKAPDGYGSRRPENMYPKFEITEIKEVRTRRRA